MNVINSPELGEYTYDEKVVFDEIMLGDECLNMYVFSETAPPSKFAALYNSFVHNNDLTKQQKADGVKGRTYYKRVIDEQLRLGQIEFEKYVVLHQQVAEIENEVSPFALELIKERAE